MTEKLFYSDGYLKKFTAKVCICEPEGEGYKVVLDRTAFFPEGGGQAADVGVLGDVKVLDVQEKDGQIWHYTDKPLAVGAEVAGELDWEIRFDRMQQHTAEHIVTGIIHGRFGYNNVGFHLGDEICTLDMNGPLTKEELEEIEYAANEDVTLNLPVEISYPTREELEKLEYRSKIEIEGQVRIVRIPGVDVCACCAPHLKQTGEVGLIKFVHTQNYKGGVRITIMCGFRALQDYRRKEQSVKSVMHILSAKEELAADAVMRLAEEHTALKNKYAALQKELLALRTEKIPAGQKLVCVFEEDLEGNAPRELMNLILDRGTTISAVFARTGENAYRYVIGSRAEDVRELCRNLNEAFQGRGGGKPEMVQGSVTGNMDELRAFMDAAAGEKE